jgi:hypothetical protein
MSSEERLRRFLLIVTIVIFAATIIELVLVEHYEDPLQVIPFALSAAGLLTTLGALLRPGRALLRTLRAVMAIVAIGGVVGVGLHLQNNIEFEQETKPDATTSEILWSSIHGASPMLASGILVLAATLATAATWRFESR